MASKSKNKLAIKSEFEFAAAHPDVWDKLGFTLQYGWLNVGELLEAPGGGPGTFKLEPFEEPDLVGQPIKRLRVTFNPKEMIPNWANTVFDTCGTRTPVLKEELPEYKKDPGVENEYRRILDDVVNELRLPLCSLQRIEGRFERIEKFANVVKHFYYTVRGIYLPRSVKSSSGQNTDLVVFIANNPQGGPAPDGGATGPPH